MPDAPGTRRAPRTLIVGSSGLTGAHAALHLRAQGEDVTLMSRTRPAPPSLSSFPHLAADYTAPDFDRALLAGFDQMVFAAGADLRQLPPGTDEEAFYQRVNSEAIPRFFALALCAPRTTPTCFAGGRPAQIGMVSKVSHSDLAAVWPGSRCARRSR